MSRESVQLKDLNGRANAAAQNVDVDAEHDPEVSRRASNAALHREAVQMRAGGGQQGNVHEAAERGKASPARAMPHMDRIQAAFGRHDVSGIQAHVGDGSAQEMGAEAYATGNHVAFAQEPDLHTAAHEAAHVVQQAQGVNLYGGVGQAGDTHERNADAVADRVVAGESAEDLLGATSAKASAAPTGAVQRKGAKKAADPADADHASEYDSRDAVGASLRLLAKRMHEAGRQMNALVDGPHDTDAGKEPAVQGIAQIFDSIFSEATHVDGLLTKYKLDDTFRKTLSDDVKLVLGAWSRFAMPMGKVNAFTKANGDPKDRNPYWIEQIISGWAEKVLGDRTIKLEGNTTAPSGTSTSVLSEAITAHIEGATSAAKSAEAGNAQDAARVQQHVTELTWLARGHKDDMKKHKKELAALSATLHGLEKSHPELKTMLDAALKEIKAL